ncbi:hypothetical protein AAG570_001220 [Ranatra chinensis]|uniref:Protein SPEC3 n=1 Tax=Ranatra chinensis TaxID=642074 RepID=A0ABD0YBI3_9HEMI
MRGAIPVLPLCLAWMCLLINILLPGIGTLMSGFLCLCFGKPRFSVNDSGHARFGAFCVNFVVAVSQLFTVIFCLVGWGWSIWWGVIMIRLASEFSHHVLYNFCLLLPCVTFIPTSHFMYHFYCTHYQLLPT